MNFPLEPPDTHHLRAAIGWMELGNHHEADEELKKIASGLTGHPDVLAVRWSISAKAQKWDVCLAVATQFTRVDPDNLQAWVDLSIALYRVGQTQKAWDALSSVADKFSEEWIVPYNLACYAAQLQNLPEAERLIRKAIGLGDAAQVANLVLTDPDLEPLRKTFKPDAGPG